MSPKVSMQKKTTIALVIGGALVFIVSVLLLAAIIIARIFYLQPYVIPTNGMHPSKPANTRAIALRQPYDSVSQIKKGDVIVFKQVNNNRSSFIISRVVGLPGDTFSQLPSGKLKVNNTELLLTEIRREGKLTIFLEFNRGSKYEVAYESNRTKPASPPVILTVGKNELFLVGDNRDHSYDSRSYGCIPFSSVIGKVIW
ncbi:MAG: signal peptidase I [Verrucomicrobiales bacterium]|nr:signal peptidase I [Verrucomicrobiales bacterium]